MSGIISLLGNRRAYFWGGGGLIRWWALTWDFTVTQ